MAEGWTSERVFRNGSDFYGSVLADIAQARERIDVEMYIFDVDHIGRRISDALVQAAARGVRIRVLADAAGCALTSGKLDETFGKSAVELRYYRRLFDHGFSRAFPRFNRRNHRKTWIFDGRVAYVGSSNIKDVHLAKADGGEDWHDLNVRLEGEEILFLEESFERTWVGHNAFQRLRNFYSQRHAPRAAEAQLIHLNDTPERRRSLRAESIRRLQNARKRVWIMNAYFAPYTRYVRELCGAAERGLDVRVLVPKNSDIFFMPWITSTYFAELLRSGVKVFTYVPSVLHAKARVIDENFVLGSSNLDYRSHLHNLEVDACVTHPESQRALEQDYEDCLQRSERVTFETIRQYPWIFRLFARLLSTLRYWV